MAVAGNATDIVNDGLPLTDQAIKERGFSHVWPADDCNNIAHVMYCFKTTKIIKFPDFSRAKCCGGQINHRLSQKKK